MTLLNKLTRSALAGAVALTILGVPVGAAPDSTYLLFDGDTNYVEVPDSTDYSAQHDRRTDRFDMDATRRLDVPQHRRPNWHVGYIALCALVG
jgi:hypothetical protein